VALFVIIQFDELSIRYSIFVQFVFVIKLSLSSPIKLAIFPLARVFILLWKPLVYIQLFFVSLILSASHSISLLFVRFCYVLFGIASFLLKLRTTVSLTLTL